MLRDLRQLLDTAAYHPAEIERILDLENPAFVKFDPDLGYELQDYVFRDGIEESLSSYIYEPHGGYRKLINYADQPCRINTYGDSLTQCAQVSDGETWQEVLAAHFREPIRNFGVGGYGVFQSYLRAMRVEATDLAARYIVLNIFDDDHKRNIDAARWIRVAWMCRNLPRGGKDTYPVHGFPWAHVRYNLKKGQFEERPGLCRKAEDLLKLVGRDNYYAAFKDDTVAHLYTLREGGEAPVAELEKLAEAFRLKVDLRNAGSRMADARKLHEMYGLRSTIYIMDKLCDWVRKEDRKLLIMLSYDVDTLKTFIENGERFDAEIIEYLDKKNIPFVDSLQAMADEYRAYKLPMKDFFGRLYVARAGAQVFGHYNPYGNFWFAFASRKALLDWLDPKPPAYH